MPKTRVLVIAGDADCGLVHQRVAQVFAKMNRDKYSFELRSSDMASGLPLFHKDVTFADLVVFVHCYSPAQATLLERCRYRFGKKVIVDIDDLLTNLPSGHPSFHLIKGNEVHVIRMLRNAHQIVASTDYLKKVVAQENEACIVIENMLDPARYEPFIDVPRPAKSDFTIGWTGSSQHLEDFLVVLKDPLKQFMMDYPNTRFFSHGTCPDELYSTFGVRVNYLPSFVSHFDYPAECSTYNIDCCLVGLVDHPFNSAKSDLRLLDMAPFNIPIIASASPEFARHEKHGRLLIARTEKDWYDKLVFALEHPDEMAAIGRRAHEYVYKDRLVDGAVARWEFVIDSVMRGESLGNQSSQASSAPVCENAIQAQPHATL